MPRTSVPSVSPRAATPKTRRRPEASTSAAPVPSVSEPGPDPKTRRRPEASTSAPPVPSVSEPGPDPKARRIARKSKRQDNRRHVLLACAREVLLAHGPVAFTMERLALAAATSKAALYYYFRSREELVAALALPILAREVEVLSRVVARADSGLDGLCALLRARVEHHLADRDGFRILYLWAPVIGDPRLLAEVHLLSAVVHTSLAARLQRDHKAGLLRHDADPRRLPDLAWSLAQGLLIRIISDPGLAWRDLLTDACTALIRGAQDPSAIRHS